MFNMFINDMYLMASQSDFNGFMNGITIVALYLLGIGFCIVDGLNKRK